MQSKVHPTYKTKYRIANWPAYNRALVRRGDVMVWFVLGRDRCLDAPPERPAGWAAAVLGSCHRNRHDPATPLPSSAAPGRRIPARPVQDDAPRPLRPRLYDALPAQSASDAPSATGAARRGPPSRARQHGAVHRRGRWSGRPRHTVAAADVAGGSSTVASNQSGVILVHTLTEATGDDATTAIDLLTAVDGPLVRVTADAASDTVAVYETATARGAKSSSHRQKRRTYLATARGRPRGIGRSRW